MIENALDSGASDIKLIVKDSGKTLIQVVDNGCGMSETDSKMSFERHATSKIRNADDLFNIKTMGFRGEAMASMAAIAHIEVSTKLTENELGTRIIIEGSEIKKQESVVCSNGTSISIKNLFYNVPARRKFLKSDKVEKKHIIEEFSRVALSNPEVSFSLIMDNQEYYH
ncbi:MAG: DNA mismatch repair protein MutL, partial [Flavobacteriales bacterium]|nr:DNA mismatch repair protein MutL [Flavobacteriales bacterium]